MTSVVLIGRSRSIRFSVRHYARTVRRLAVARVYCARGDIGNESSVYNQFAHVRVRHRLAGVVHSAVLLRDSLITNATSVIWCATFITPKWQAPTAYAKRLSRLRCVACCSTRRSPPYSATSARPCTQQSTAMSTRLLKAGVGFGWPSTALAWGNWADVGLATRCKRHTYRKLLGFLLCL